MVMECVVFMLWSVESPLHVCTLPINTFPVMDVELWKFLANESVT